jgi:hypothetical protein
MLLNHYTAFLEKHMQGRLGSYIDESGKPITFSSLAAQSAEALLPMLLHQSAEIIIGSDNTAETGSSYCLKKMITAGINIGLSRSVVDNSDGSHSSIVIANCTNTSSAPITIGEIGFRKYVDYGYSDAYLLFDRTPLGTPLTIQPGEVGRIVYTITMA